MSEAEASTTPGLSASGDVGDKFNVAKERKAAGDEAFKNNDLAAGEPSSASASRILYHGSRAHRARIVAFRHYHEVSAGRLF